MMRTLLPKNPLRRLARQFTHWQPRRVHELARDTDAAIAPMVAVLGGSLVLAAGLALDITLYITGNRDLRSATEAAALAAAQNPADAQNRATTYLTRQGYDASVLQSVQVGRYCANSHLTVDQRFDPTFSRCPGSGMANAVRVTATRPSRRFLTGVLGASNPIPDLAATATAARIDEAGIGITSGVLDISTPLVPSIIDTLEVPVNTILGALLNTAPLDLQSRDVEAMMSHDVDAGLFFDNLAQRRNFTGTYNDLLEENGPFVLSDVLNAAADATSDQLSAAALRKVAGSPGAQTQIDLSHMFGLGVWKNMPVGEADARPALRAGMNAYQLLTFATQRVGGKIDLSGLTSTLSGTNSTVRVGAVVMDSGAQPNFSFGPAGETTVATAAARLEVKVGLPDITLLNQRVTVNIPLVLEVAPASGTIDRITCSGTNEQRRDTEIEVTARTGLVSAFIGKATPEVMNRPFGTPILVPTPEAITKLELDLTIIPILPLKINAGIEGKAELTNLVQAATDTRTFGPNGSGKIGSPDTLGIPITVNNRSQISNSVSTLLNKLELNVGTEVNLLGLNLSLLNLRLATLKSQLIQQITGLLTDTISGVVDPLLDAVLGALGIRLGHATVWATGARCGVPVLV